MKNLREVSAMVLELPYLKEFLAECQRVLQKHPEEVKAFFNESLVDVIYAVLYAGYIRGKDPDFDLEEVLGELFRKFVGGEWKKVNGEEFYYDEDMFRVMGSEFMDFAERLYPIVLRFLGEEPIKGPIGRVVFKQEE
jgi:hypothetical protein